MKINLYERIQFRESDKWQIGDWFKIDTHDPRYPSIEVPDPTYGVIIAIQKNGSPKGIIASNHRNTSSESLNGWYPRPYQIEKSEVPDKLLKKIEKKLYQMNIQLPSN